MGALAEFERDLIRERTKAGLETARARGRKGGRPASLSDSDKKMIKLMSNNQEISPAEIAKRFRISRATYYRTLKEVE
jgi:DNA invertase Pin-like site-specific DNA recombinase